MGLGRLLIGITALPWLFATQRYSLSPPDSPSIEFGKVWLSTACPNNEGGPAHK